MSLSLRLLILVLMAALPVFAVQVFSELRQRETRFEEISRQVLQTTRLVARQQDGFIDGARYLMALTAALPEIVDRDVAGCTRRLTAIAAAIPEVTVAVLADADGRIVCANMPFGDTSLEDRGYFRRAVDSGRFAISELLVGRISGHDTIAMAAPIFDGAEVDMVIVLGIDLRVLSATLATSELPPGATISLIDRNGILAARAPDAEQWIGRKARDEPFLAEMVARREGARLATGIDGIERFYGYAPLVATGELYTVVGIPVDGVFADAENIFIQEIALMALVFLLAAIAAWLAGEIWIRRPVVALRNAVRQVGEGDFGVRAPARAHGSREVASLADSFDAMAAALERNQATLRENEARFRQLADSMPQIVWAAGPDGRLDYFNRRWYETTVAEPGQEGDDSWLSVLHPEDVDHTLERWYASVRSGTAYEIEYRFMDRLTGRYRWHLGRARPIRDEAGAIVRWYGTSTDIDDRRRAEELLAESRERLMSALEASSTGTFRWTIRGDILSWDENLNRLFGRPGGALASSISGLLDLVHPDDRRGVAEGFARCGREGGEIAMEFRIIRPDGGTVWMAARGNAVVEGGVPRHLTGACRDISNRKRTQERQRLIMAELDHRVKNILATVRSLVAQTRRTTASFEEFSAAIEGRVAAMARTHDLLNLSQWDGVGLRDLVLGELEPYRDAGGGNLCVPESNPLLTPRVASALSMAIHELATNAAKYGALTESSGRVEVRWRIAEADTGPRLILSWAETGGPPVVEPDERGFGCTLIERGLAYELEGRVDLEFRAEGVRCEIDVSLGGRQSEAAPPPPAARTVRPPPVDQRALAGKRILVVEDSLLIAMDIEAALAGLGCIVVGPETLLDRAIAIALDEPLDAAMLDVNVAGQEVFPVADALDRRGIPFVFATGYDGGTVLPARFAERAMLRKPFDAADLAAALVTILTGSRSQSPVTSA